MKKLVYVLIVLFLTANTVYAENNFDSKENKNDTTKFTYINPLTGLYKDPSQVVTPPDAWDTFRFSDSFSGYVRPGLYALGPGLMLVWGLAEWDWGSSRKFSWYPQNPWGAWSVDGGVDKLGHMFGTYVAKRSATFFLRAAGYSKARANFEGAIMAELMQLVTEVGDGFSTMYGFDYWDFVFNNIGILAGVILDAFPTLDRMFALQWEYVPTRQFKEDLTLKMSELDFLTDYSGQKFFLTTKMGGIPYVSQTPFRYFNFDVGFFSRGYKPLRHYKYRTQNVQIGFSVNFAIGVGDLLPTNYVTSGVQKFLKYYHVPKDIELKKYVLIRMEREDYIP